MTMVANLHVTKHREYPIFTLVCPFCFFFAFASFHVAKQKNVVVEGGSFIEFQNKSSLGLL
jgi:hypothetical protein